MVLRKLCLDLKGTAGGYGYPQISQAAHDLLDATTNGAPAKQLKELGPAENVEYIERERHAVAVHEACHAVVAYRTRHHLEIDIATLGAYDRSSGARLQGGTYREALKSCSATGANVEGNRKARDQAAQATIAFLRKTLAP